jgi:hypothetical protein
MSKNYADLAVIVQPDPRCDTCSYVLPSQTASTGLRCGFDYFNSSYIMRKFQLMQHFPEVHNYNACGAWTNEPLSLEPQSGFGFSVPSQDNTSS